jgi:dihydropteroate synthase
MESKLDTNSSEHSPVIFGVLNITEDSFSDGGKYLTHSASLQKAESLVSQGANVIDIGAQSSNIQAGLVGPEIEWVRMKNLIPDLIAKGVRVSVDSFQPEVIARSLEAGAEFINHIRGFVDSESVREISKFAGSDRKFILMYSHNQSNRAEKNSHLTQDNVISEIVGFFRERKKTLIEAGIPQEQLIFDPGMGFFLSPDFQVSFEVLRRIQTLQEEFSIISDNAGFTLTFLLVASSSQAKMCPKRLPGPANAGPTGRRAQGIFGAEWPSTRPNGVVARAAGKTCCDNVEFT